MLDENLWILSSVNQGFKKGYLLYCETEKYPSATFFLQKAYPPGMYVYFYSMSLLGNNFSLILLELINAGLIYKIVDKHYGKKAAMNAIALIAFFPISIMNSGFTIDPIQISLLFILLSYILLTNDKPILAAICLSLGTLIIYVPAIMLVPILIYCIRNNRIIDFIKIIIAFIFTTVLCILPFLITCPDKFINVISNSLSQTQTSNYLNNEDLFLSQFLLFNILEIQLFGIIIGVTILNVIQIAIILLTILYLYNRYEFNEEMDIILSLLILILVIKVVTFYIHFRFLYWIFMFSLLYISMKSNEILEIKHIISLGILMFATTLFILILSLIQFTQDVILLYTIQAGIILIIPTFIFLILGLTLFKNEDWDSNFRVKNVIYHTIFIMIFNGYMIIQEFFSTSDFTFLMSIILILLLTFEIFIIYLYVNRLLIEYYKLNNQDIVD